MKELPDYIIEFRANRKTKTGLIVYLGMTIQEFECWLDEKLIPKQDIVWDISYDQIGMIGSGSCVKYKTYFGTKELTVFDLYPVHERFMVRVLFSSEERLDACDEYYKSAAGSLYIDTHSKTEKLIEKINSIY